MMKRALAVILAAGFAVSVFATDARVAVMGRQRMPYFYRDEISVFTNPADMSLYPNLLYGSFGWLDTTATGNNYNMKSVQPNDPFFGGMISYGFSDEESGPMLSIGAFVNRKDYIVEQLLNVGGRNGRKPGEYNLVDPLGKIDLLVGYDIGNGLALGLGFYTAYQSEEVDGILRNRTAVFKGSAGINYNIEQGLDFEASVNGGSTEGKWVVDTKQTTSEDDMLNNRYKVSDGEYFLRGDVRFFSAVPAINGSFVPQVSLTYMKLAGANVTDLAGGVGINMNIDRGFFWTGLQGVYTQYNGGNTGDPQSIGARLSFGIERNIVWDWFLIRVGGQKEFRYKTSTQRSDELDPGKTRTEWLESPESNGGNDDLVGLGFGINIDNRLRIDFVASEDLPYTLTNLISGAQPFLFNRVSATYRF